MSRHWSGVYNVAELQCHSFLWVTVANGWYKSRMWFAIQATARNLPGAEMKPHWPTGRAMVANVTQRVTNWSASMRRLTFADVMMPSFWLFATAKKTTLFTTISFQSKEKVRGWESCNLEMCGEQAKTKSNGTHFAPGKRFEDCQLLQLFVYNYHHKFTVLLLEKHYLWITIALLQRKAVKMHPVMRCCTPTNRVSRNRLLV